MFQNWSFREIALTLWGATFLVALFSTISYYKIQSKGDAIGEAKVSFGRAYKRVYIKEILESSETFMTVIDLDGNKVILPRELSMVELYNDKR